MGLALYPLFRIWFHVLQPQKRKTSQSQRRLYCAFEYHEIDGVLGYNAMLVAVFCGGLVTVSPVGFDDFASPGITVTFTHSFIQDVLCSSNGHIVKHIEPE
jgi:hypothetical protein